MTDLSYPHASIAGWQTLGELELAINPDTESTVNKWLAVILSPLEFHTDFLNRVLKSAQEAASCAMNAEGVRRFEHLHLLVFVPVDHTPNGQNWGFYRIEKVEEAAGTSNPDHAIEFYLYRE